MEIIKDFPQNTNEWHNLRACRMTASEAHAIYTAGKGLETYIYKKMAQYFSTATPEIISSKDIERGKRREPQANFLYEVQTGYKVENVAFIIKNDYIGCSPDGLINHDGLVEYKSLNDENFLRQLISFEMDKKHYSQIQMQLDCTHRKWCDYVLYNPNFKQELIINRIEPDEKFIKKLTAGYAVGENLIKNIKQKMEMIK